MTRTDDVAWHIGVSPWIIEDGNYQDFRVGQKARFAIEFYSEQGLRVISHVSDPVVKHLGGSNYGVLAKVIYISEAWWVLDFGVKCFQEAAPPKGVSPGSFVEGSIYVGIDPYFYFEYLHRQPGAPALTYEWNVTGITREVSPLIPDPTRLNTLIGDDSRLRREQIAATDAWHEGRDLLVHYILHCQLHVPDPGYPTL